MAAVKPIRNEADYEAALDEVERLWGARLGTPRGDRLDVLATLIKAYEEKNHPIDPRWKHYADHRTMPNRHVFLRICGDWHVTDPA